MNANDLMDIIGNSDEKYVHDAHESKANRRKRQIINLALGAAACMILAPMVLFGGMTLFFGGVFGAGAAAPEAYAPDIDTPDTPVSTFSNYTGPVMAITALENSSGITAERSLKISLAPLCSGEDYEAFAELSDSYLLTNSTSADISLTMAYPFAATWYEANEQGLVPELLIDGQLRSVTVGDIVYGPYSGTFVPVYGADYDPEMTTANLEGPAGYNEYITLLMEGMYIEESFSEVPELDQAVTVYKLSDYEYTSDTGATNPTLQFCYEADSSKTQVLTWNFNGGSNYDENGYYERHAGGIIVRPEASPENIYPEDAYLVVLGEDIKNYSVQGYRNGGCKDGDELSDLGCSVTRYETTLGEVLRDLIKTGRYFGNRMQANTESLYRICVAALMDFGPISTDPVTRYSFGMLDQFVYDVSTHNRIAYLSFPITVPAGETVEIELRSPKELSYNYHGAGDTELYRLDFAGNHGSTLEFSSVKVSLSDYEGIELTANCFGFDLSAGVTETEIIHKDLTHWYMDIRKKPAGG